MSAEQDQASGDLLQYLRPTVLIARTGAFIVACLSYHLSVFRTLVGLTLSAIEERLSGIPLHGQLTFGSPKHPLSFILSAVSVLYFLLRYVITMIYDVILTIRKGKPINQYLRKFSLVSSSLGTTF